MPCLSPFPAWLPFLSADSRRCSRSPRRHTSCAHDGFFRSGREDTPPASFQSAPISLRSTPQQGQARSATLSSWTLGSYRKILEVGKIAPSPASLHAPKLFLRIGARWKIVRIHRLAIHLLGEVSEASAPDRRRIAGDRREARSTTSCIAPTQAVRAESST